MLVFDPPGTYRILRATFPLGVLPDVINRNNPPGFLQSATSQVLPDATVEIPDIPEPVGAASLACAILLLRRRR